MARRGHQKVLGSRIWLVGILFLLVGTASVLLLQFRAAPFRTIPVLSPADYFENSNSLRGNTYQLDGVVISALGSSPNKGRLFSFRIRTNTGEWPLPVLVPPGYQIINLQKGQKYKIKVVVNDSGLLEVEDITKS